GPAPRSRWGVARGEAVLPAEPSPRSAARRGQRRAWSRLAALGQRGADFAYHAYRSARGGGAAGSAGDGVPGTASRTRAAQRTTGSTDPPHNDRFAAAAANRSAPGAGGCEP